MTRTFNLTAVLVFLGLLFGCDSVGGFDDGVTAKVDGLKIHLFAPGTVAASDSFEVRFVVLNRTFEEVTIVTPSGCLVVPGVFEGSQYGLRERVPFRGSVIACTAAITEHEIPGRQTVERTFDLEAVLPRYDEREDEPVPPGDYLLRVGLDWTIEGKKVDLVAVERELVVRP